MATTIDGVKTLQIRNAKNGDFDLNLEGCDCAYLESLIYNAYPTKSETGNPIYFDDGADSVPVKELIVNLEPKQSGSGDPSPSNVRAISGYDGVKVKRNGKNLYDHSKVNVGGFSNSNGTFTNTQTDTLNYLNLRIDTRKSGTNIELIGEAKITTTGRYHFTAILTKDFDALRIKHNGGTRDLYLHLPFNLLGTITVSLDVDGTNPSIVGGLVLKNIQIELGSTATDFEPYTEQDYSITFPSSVGTVYGGTLNVTTGVLTVDRKGVDLGTLSWSAYVDETPHRFMAVASDLKYGTDSICSHYPCVNNVKIDKSVYVYNSYYAQDRIAVFDNSYNSDAEFKTGMNGVILCYPLKTPTTVQLTPTEVSTLLGSNTITSDGSINLTYRADTTMVIEKLTNAIVSLGGNV